MNDAEITRQDELRINVEKLTESELEELANLVVRKLRDSMREERDRSGRF
jgi:hypothetical protein